MAFEGLPKLYSKEQAMDLLDVDRRKLNELIRLGQIGHLQLTPRNIRFYGKHIREYLIRED